MSGNGFAINGIGALIAKLQVYSDAQVYPHVRDVLMDAANKTYNVSQQMVPVDTGQLKDSGAIEVLDDSPKHILIRVSYSAPYALFVEMGHMSRAGIPVSPQHFLLPAYHLQRDRVMGALLA